MKKQSGFTLIELMVVMAIIAILATAGLAAYTGYIKKARDTRRLADVSAINSIIVANMASSTGKPPATPALVVAAIVAANNGNNITDPLVGKTSTCLTGDCYYYYNLCDNGTGFQITAPVESSSNTAIAMGSCYSADASPAIIQDNVVIQ